MTTVFSRTESILSGEIAALSAAVAGPVLQSGEPGYARETAAFNLVHPQRPAVAVGASNPQDVQAAVAFASRHGMPVAVLATGHGAVAPSDGAVLINTSRMTGVTIDAEKRTAWVEAGVRWKQVVDDAAKSGLAPLAGSSPDVGVVAYTLGGGLSPVLGRAYGYAADHVRSMDLVTAEGRLRTVTSELEPELFWALRGGTGNFGVVTAIEFDLLPVTRLYGGGLYFDGTDTAEVLTAWTKVIAGAPDDFSSSVVLLRVPDLPEVPQPLRGRFVVHVRVSHLGTEAEAEARLAPLRAAATPIVDMVGEMPFTAFAAIHNDPTGPLPAYERKRTALLREFTPEVIDVLVQRAGANAAAPVAAVEIRMLGGALSRAPKVANVVDNRDAAFTVFAADIAGPQDAARSLAALDELITGLEPWSTGSVYLNFMSVAEPGGSVRNAYRLETYIYLLRAKKKYDPQNMFRINHNLRAPA